MSDNVTDSQSDCCCLLYILYSLYIEYRVDSAAEMLSRNEIRLAFLSCSYTALGLLQFDTNNHTKDEQYCSEVLTEPSPRLLRAYDSVTVMQ